MPIRSIRSLSFIIGCLLATFPIRADDAPPTGAVLQFPIPFQLTQIWSCNDHETVDLGPSFVFITGNAVDPIHGAQVVIADESLLTNDGLVELLTTEIAADDERLLYQGDAPQYNRTFTRCDVDGDGVDEVLLSGRGGAGGTTLLHVFALNESGVKRLYYDAAKFGLILIDSDGDDLLEIWNSGIDFDVDEEAHMLKPTQYTVYSLKDGEYIQTGEVSREEAERVFADHELCLRLDSANLRVYE